MASDKHILVIGAGPGGLTAAMILARRGLKVTVVEKQPRVGGRNGELMADGYSHDIGPTFLIMRFLLDEMFSEAGRKSEDYLEFVRLDPMYELIHDDFHLNVTDDPARMREEIRRVFPGQEEGFDRFLKTERSRFEKMYPCLQKPYSSFSAYFAPVFLKALPSLALGKSLYEVLAGYFDPERLRISFTFQSKYLGMSPWSCPGAFAIIPFMEYGFGIDHVQGGLNRISTAMAKVIEEEGGEIRLSTPVKQLLVKDGATRGVILEDGSTIEADDVVINADFAHAMTHLADPKDVRKYTRTNLENRDYSCSTFMLYLGVDKVYPVTHHTIVFARDYKKNLDDIANRMVLSEDISFYVRNASVTDPNIAPEGHSSVYVLVPVPNNKGGIDWNKEEKPFRDRVLRAIEDRTAMKDLSDHIRSERIIHPGHWEKDGDIFLGATFNLAHSLGQMLYLRPRNRFEEWDHCYLVGGGTHPGSGLPTIYESGRISANLICERYGIPFEPPPPLPV